MTLPSTLILPFIVLVFLGDSVICALAGASPWTMLNMYHARSNVKIQYVVGEMVQSFSGDRVGIKLVEGTGKVVSRWTCV